MTHSPKEFSDELLALLIENLPESEPIYTLARGQPNWLDEVSRAGITVETERTRAAGSGAQFVPAWMFEVAWQRLVTRQRLTNRELLSSDDLNVKRSSLVCAALARLPGVNVTSTKPITMTYQLH